jgi:hypothetical protein
VGNLPRRLAADKKLVEINETPHRSIATLARMRATVTVTHAAPHTRRPQIEPPHEITEGRMTQLERAIFDAEGKLLDALHAMRVQKFEMAAHYAAIAWALIEAIRQQNEEVRNDQT